MTDDADGGADFEIALPVCRCAAPADRADQLEASFGHTPGWRVRRELGPHPRAPIALHVAHVHTIQIKRVPMAPRQPPDLAPSAAAVFLVEDRISAISRDVLKTVVESAAVHAVAARGREEPGIRWLDGIWMPVFDVTRLIRTGVELHVMSDSDADRQLDALAPVLNFSRQNITIKPPVGWRNYGHPDLLPRKPGST